MAVEEPAQFGRVHTMNPISLLGREVTGTVDRPLGSAHPQHGFIYPVNYGYIPGAIAADREDLDAYILGVFEPVQQFTRICIAVIDRTFDEARLIVVPEGKGYSDAQIRALTEFHERFFTSVITGSLSESQQRRPFHRRERRDR